jgi:CRP/FNR family transcriptional activator FtrB
METGGLGKEYQNDEFIFRQGDAEERMYVVMEGRVELFVDKDGTEVSLGLRREGDFLGESALFVGELRSSSARAHGLARVLTIDRRSFLRHIQADPTLAFRLVETLSLRIKELDQDVVVLSRALQDCMAERLG